MTCPECDGDGKVWDTLEVWRARRCPGCNGTGEVEK